MSKTKSTKGSEGISQEKVDEIWAVLKKEKERIIDKLTIKMLLTFIIEKGLEDELQEFGKEWIKAKHQR